VDVYNLNHEGLDAGLSAYRGATHVDHLQAKLYLVNCANDDARTRDAGVRSEDEHVDAAGAGAARSFATLSRSA